MRLRDIKGVMRYFYDKKGQGNLVMELNGGTIVKINTKNPETNKEILEELDKQLKRLELHKG